MNHSNFITGAVGEIGAGALSKALERIPSLGPALAPRILVSWLTAVEAGYTGSLPGIEGSHLSLHKSEETYSGVVTVNGDSYIFEDESFIRVAAGLAVSMGIDGRMDPSLKASELSNLGKSIDKLVFVQAERLSKAGVELPGKPAAAIKPLAPNSPHPQEKQKGQPAIPGMGGSKTGGQPSIVAKGEIKVSKVELDASKCPDCGAKEFEGEKFVGCPCFNSLEKSDSLFKRDGRGGWTLSLGKSWSHDSISRICKAVKG